jgi:hypothetical protein
VDADRGTLRPLSLRFFDDGVERDYQRQGGAESQTGFRVTTAAAALMWLLAALVIPTGTPIPSDRAIPLSLAMAILNWIAFLLPRAETLDHKTPQSSCHASSNTRVGLGNRASRCDRPAVGPPAARLQSGSGFSCPGAVAEAPQPGAAIV